MAVPMSSKNTSSDFRDERGIAAPEATGVISRVPVASDTLEREIRAGAATAG